MPISRLELPLSSTLGLRALRWSTDEPYVALKESFAVGRLESGALEWSSAGRVWQSTPGTLLLKRPGDVHRDRSRHGTVTFQVVVFSSREVEDAIGGTSLLPQIERDDARGTSLQRLHDAVASDADALTLEVLATEAVSSLGPLRDARYDATRPVRRVRALLRERLDEAITLEQLASHAGVDKFYLCRTFRAQVGLAPYAYLTRLRIARAKELLASGVKPRDVASRVGLYDQAQLNRHFRRLVGTTPGRYAAT